jgi:hypothetical protein
MTDLLDKLFADIAHLPEDEQSIVRQWIQTLLQEKERMGERFTMVNPQIELKRIADKVLARLNPEQLRDVTEQCVRSYAGEGLNGVAWFVKTGDGLVMAVVGVGTMRDERFTNLGLLVRVASDTVFIEADINNKPLVDMLLHMGVPREQIVLTYAGEKVEETA